MKTPKSVEISATANKLFEELGLNKKREELQKVRNEKLEAIEAERRALEEEEKRRLKYQVQYEEIDTKEKEINDEIEGLEKTIEYFQGLFLTKAQWIYLVGEDKKLELGYPLKVGKKEIADAVIAFHNSLPKSDQFEDGLNYDYVQNQCFVHYTPLKNDSKEKVDSKLNKANVAEKIREDMDIWAEGEAKFIEAVEKKRTEGAKVIEDLRKALADLEAKDIEEELKKLSNPTPEPTPAPTPEPTPANKPAPVVKPRNGNGHRIK